MGSEDAAGVLDETAPEGDRACQEQRVECGTVEAFADEVACRDHNQRRVGIGWGEPPDGGGALFGAHAALEDDRSTQDTRRSVSGGPWLTVFDSLHEIEDILAEANRMTGSGEST
jgi:hypothetical protein